MSQRGNFHNEPPENGLSNIVSRDDAKLDFSRRLSRFLLEKGWNQSDLARASQKFMPEGKAFGRDRVSHYIRGRAVPNPTSLNAMCQALGVEPTDLMPSGINPSSTKDIAPKLEVRDMGEGYVWLKVNRAVSKDTALKIQQMIYEDDAS